MPQKNRSRASGRDLDKSPGQPPKLQKFKLRAPFWEGQEKQVN
ncbi:MAG: hypothetical protein RIB65_18625 [Ilumatobacter fluminis]